MIALPKIQYLLADATLTSVPADCSGITSSPSAVPGTEPANAVEASRLLAKGCLQTLPDVAVIKTALTGAPFTIQSTFGIFNYKQQNLSTKVVPPQDAGYCSIVFGSPIAAEQVTQLSRTGIQSVSDSDAANANTPPRLSAKGSSLYSARTNAQ
jgi:hypothetical protein